MRNIRTYPPLNTVIETFQNLSHPQNLKIPKCIA